MDTQGLVIHHQNSLPIDLNSAQEELKKRSAEVLAAFFANFPSKNTADSYAQTAKEFMLFVGQYVRSFAEIRREHIIFYKKYLEKSGLADKTILRKMSGISSLCKFLAHEGLIEKDITYGVKRPKSFNKKETAALTEEDVRQIFASLNPKAYSFYAHRALLGVGFYTGLRSSEIRNLTIGDLNQVNGHHIIRTRIKGNKPHEVPINEMLYEYLCEHIEQLRSLGFSCHKQDYLFPRLKPRENKPISGHALGKILKHYLKKAGISLSDARRYSPHTMRATVATHLLNVKEAPLEDVQKLLGHATPATTQRYNKSDKELHKSPAYKIKY